MGAGTIRWSGTCTLPATGPGTASSIAVSLATLAATDRVVVTPSGAAQQIGWYDVKGPFGVQVVKTASTGFSVYAHRGQVPVATTYDYIVLTTST